MDADAVIFLRLFEPLKAMFPWLLTLVCSVAALKAVLRSGPTHHANPFHFDGKFDGFLCILPVYWLPPKASPILPTIHTQLLLLLL